MNAKKRWSAALEVIFVFGLVMAQIWILPNWFRAITAVVVITFVISGLRYIPEGQTCSEYTGFGRWKNYGNGKWKIKLDFSQAGRIFVWMLLSFIGMLALAFFINPGFWQKERFWDKIWDELRNYLMCWALVQQFFIQSCVANRFEVVCQKKWLAAFLTGSLFYIVHFPNPVLMPGTFLLGAFGSYFFLSGRNLYLLAIVHSILGTAVKYLIAYDLLNHSMRVGPGFWE